MSKPSDRPSESSPPVVILASDYWRASESIVDGAARLAEAVVLALKSARTVTVSLRGVRGVTSSFANVVLQRVAEAHGPASMRERLLFETDSEAQRQVLSRSMDAAEQLR